MKTRRLIVLLLIGGLVRLTAQIEVVSGGNVGIGTTNPSVALEIVGSVKAKPVAGSFTFAPTIGNAIFTAQRATQSTGQVGIEILGGTNGTNWQLYQPLSSDDFRIFGNSGDRMTVTSSGNVGIGTTNPTSGRLQVEGGDIALGADGSDRRLLIWSNTEGADAILIRRSDNSNAVSIATSAFGKSLLFKVGGSETVRFRNDGNVGIGTRNPGYKLEVAGTVRAASFISNTTTYADFVFKPGYKLPSLSEVEAHIAEHGTLPGVPSEAQVAKEGIDLAAMQVKLLQKIEEITLHQIAQAKDIVALKAENARLQRQLSTLSLHP